MLQHTRWLSGLAVACGVLVAGDALAADKAASSAPGVVRITDGPAGIQQSSHVVYRPVSPHELMNLTLVHPVGRYRDVSGGYGNGNCEHGNCGDGSCGCQKKSWCSRLGGGCLKRIWDADVRYKKCKFGYFCPTGGSGQGVGAFGTYDIVYPANPGYADARDGRVYAAQGTGMPMAVPLAPNVRHSFNYGWGIPSSRRTPISRPGAIIR